MIGRLGDPRGAADSLPGNADAIDGEVRRLDDLKDRLWETGEALRRLSVDGWAGQARDGFDAFRQAFAHQWLTAGDRHEDAARALERYHSTLLELRRRVDPATEPVDLERWRQQLRSAARTAAAAIRQAARELGALPRLLTEPVTHRPAPPSNVHSGLDPRLARADPAGFHRRVRALSETIRAAEIIVIRPK